VTIRVAQTDTVLCVSLTMLRLFCGSRMMEVVICDKMMSKFAKTEVRILEMETVVGEGLWKSRSSTTRDATMNHKSMLQAPFDIVEGA